MDERRIAAARTLLGCMAEAAPGASIEPGLPAGASAALVALARHHRALGFLAAAAHDVPGLDDATAGGLARWHREQVTGQLRAVADLAALGRLLGAAGIPWLVIKGPAIAALLYPRPELRTFEDVDVVVPQEAFGDVIRTLQTAGLEVVDRNWELIRRERRGQLHVRLPNGSVADVHWHLLNRDHVRDGFRIDMGAVFGRARSLTVDGLELRTAGEVDTLVHLGLHAALSGGDKLIWLKDAELAATAGPPWVEVVDVARSWGAGCAIGTILARAVRALDAPVPPGVIGELLPRWRRRMGRAIDARWPTELADGSVTPAVLWAQTQRDGGRGWAGALARRIARRPATFLLRTLGGEGWRGEGTGAVLLPSGDASDRDAFLRDVSDRGAGAA
jgi:hypothetical protein